LKLDIAIDLSGYTKGGRTAIFAKRIAPIQINYLGYPGTMGAKYYDYLIADEILIKPGEERFYSEKIIYMPDSYQVNDQDRKIYSPIDNRKFWNLPENETVYCCFNNNYKITEFTFKAWMRILKEVPKSVLWLLKDNELVVANLRNQAEKNGVDGQRIIFAKRVDFDAHIERQKFADLFLDTLPYNAHTTASDALWVGVPLITLGGNTFASRVASSLLMAIEMPELIASSLADYEQMAIEIGRSPQKISALKERLVDKIFEAPLFDTDKFVRNLENAFLEIYSRFSKQLPPDHIKVQKLCKS
jgi:predicted O-linked N-acetylglucosamine transferase (SPINDLY family)